MPGKSPPQPRPNETIPTILANLESLSGKYWRGPPLSPWQLSLIFFESYAQYCPCDNPFRNAGWFMFLFHSKNVWLHCSNGTVSNSIFFSSFVRLSSFYWEKKSPKIKNEWNAKKVVVTYVESLRGPTHSQ